MPRESKIAATKKQVDKVTGSADLRKKLVLVVVLVVGLVAALLTQPDKNTERVVFLEDLSRETEVTDSVVVVSNELGTSVADDQAVIRGTVTETRTMPRIELDRIIQLTLLAADSNRSAPPVIKDVPKVQAIYGSTQERAALIGRTIVRDGQPLPGGGTILQVTKDGIRLGQD
ncbi:MAG: hypothetical protein AAGI63_13550 [Planctomycetota bacterium]